MRVRCPPAGGRSIGRPSSDGGASAALRLDRPVTRSAARTPRAENPMTAILRNGQTLNQEEKLESANGYFYIQGDGNVVVRRKDWSIIWHSGSGGHPTGHKYLTLQNDGNLVARVETGQDKPTDVVLWHTHTWQAGSPTFLQLHDDLRLVLYRGTPEDRGEVLWQAVPTNPQLQILQTFQVIPPFSKVDEKQLYERRITQALDLVVDCEDMLWGALGTWKSTRDGNRKGSWIEAANKRRFFGFYPPGGSKGHETAGVGLAAGSAGVVAVFESSGRKEARTRGGIRILRPDGTDKVAIEKEGYYFQAASVGGGYALVAASQHDTLSVHLWYATGDGGGAWRSVPTSVSALAHRQRWYPPTDEHLVFCTRYQNGGSHGLMRVRTADLTSGHAPRGLVSYSGLPAGAEGIATGAWMQELPANTILAGTFGDDYIRDHTPWRGASNGAHVGLLDVGSGRTRAWVDLNGSEVSDILPLGSGYFAVSVKGPAVPKDNNDNHNNEDDCTPIAKGVDWRKPASVYLVRYHDQGLRIVHHVELGENAWCGGLAAWRGKLYCLATPGGTPGCPLPPNDHRNLATTYECLALGLDLTAA
ncbi:MAG: hypothetical protein D6798_08615 [Deltaproteobacteria bacterium]|nr:MAG: hypothetical protein D6798_08615 [Deltaproteobacteria bacterium]